MTPLTGWENFYVIVGSSAGALIGLQFVAISLIAPEIPVGPSGAQAGHAYSTPTIVHFGVALFLSGMMTAPWHSAHPVEVLWGVLGFTGLIYEAVVTRRMRTQNAYKPVFEDWLFHVILPVAAYAAIAAAALESPEHLEESLFGIGAAALLLMFVGIHNAWDAVTYHIFERRRIVRDSQKAKGEVV